MNLNQVTVPSKDVAKSIEFYKKLGLKLIVENLPHYARFELPEGDSTFSIHLVENLPSGEGTIVYFESENIDNVVKEISENEIKVDEMPSDREWLWREASLRDPDNNHIIIFYAGKNRKNPPWRIG
jgi:catechol 2,3-dioxygenase-like lactoylglutathione lyase family enzyme